MKRYVSFICIFCLLVMFVAKPISVSASSFEPESQDMVDLFSILDNYEKFYPVVNGVANIHLDLPLTFIGYIEFLIYSDSVVTSATINGVPANIVDSGSVTRIYLNRDYITYSIDLTINGDGGNWVILLNGQFSGNKFAPKTVPCEVESFVTNEPLMYYYNGSAIDVFTHDNEYLNTDFRLRFYIDDYKFYDYINFSLSFFVSSIISVTVGMGDTLLVPYDITYIQNPSADVNNDDRFRYFVKICLDLSNLDLSLYDYPITVSISGVLEDLSDHDYVYCSLLNVTGFISTSDPNPVIYWFRKTYIGLTTWFSSLLQVLENVYSGNIVPGKSFQQQVDQKDQQLEDMAAVMESVEQPDLNSVNVSANSYVNGTVLAASMSGITSVFSDGLFFDMIVMSIMMATAGYVLFGKR